MFMRDMKRFGLFVALTLLFFYTSFGLFRHSKTWTTGPGSWFEPDQRQWSPKDEAGALQGLEKSNPLATDFDYTPGDRPMSQESGTDFPYSGAEVPEDKQLEAPHVTDSVLTNQPQAEDLAPSHQEIFSLSTWDKKYFSIEFGKKQAINPNILPHPSLDNTWTIVAQEVRESETGAFVELSCDAVLERGVLRCLEDPAELPISPTSGGRCGGELEFFNLNVGPHDARAFFGPEKPYAVFGSNSLFTCFGQFVQDFTTLVDWKEETEYSDLFRTATELQRPPPWSAIEKNWFLFWDVEGKMFIHYDIVPHRVFAEVAADGSVGPNLAPTSAFSDEQCFASYLPKLASEHESLHQATNSLLVTMCRRSESSCFANDENTFIITIYQHKTFYGFHGVYEPYVMAFNSRPPFVVHGMSRRPLWISGREFHPDRGTSDMFYITSMSWKSRGQRYHGFIDDEVFLAFGIEDEKAGGIDVLAEDLLGKLGICD